MVLHKCPLYNTDHGSASLELGCFQDFCCEHIQLAKRRMENKAHLNTQNSTVRFVFLQAVP